MNKQQQQQWSMVTSIFAAVSRIATDEQAIQTEMSKWIQEFEDLTGNKARVKIRMLPTPSLDLIDCSKDDMKLRVETDGYTLLRATTEGISAELKVAYKKNYSFSNAALAESLRALAANIDRLPVELREQTEAIDIASLIGMSSAQLVEDEAPAAVIDAPEVAQDAQAPNAEESVDDEPLISLEPASDAESEDVGQIHNDQ